MGTPIPGAPLDHGGETHATHGIMATLTSATSAIAGKLTSEWRKARTAKTSGGVRRPPCSEDETESGQALTAQDHAYGSDQGQVGTAAAAHEESSDTVEMACVGTTGSVSVRPGDTVSHIKSWRRAIVKSVAFGAGGHGLVTVRFGHGDCLTAEAALFMADRAPDHDKEPADKHRERDSAFAAPAGVRVAGSAHENFDEQGALEAGWPGRREVEAVATAMLAAGRADGGGTMPRRQGARPSGHSSPTARAKRRVPRCINPTCGYQANTNVDETCKYYGYCCGSCRLRHTGEKYCAKDHGPACDHVRFGGSDHGAVSEAASNDDDDNPWVGLEDV